MTTKLLFFFFTTLNFGFTFSQNIQISDINFKKKLLDASPANQIAKDLNGNYTVIDKNSDNEIQISEANDISYLRLNSSSIANLSGINFFTNLKYLNVSSNSSLTNLKISNFLLINELIVSPNSGLSQLEITNNPALKSLDVSSLYNLATLDCSGNGLTILNILNSGNVISKLSNLNCSHNQLTSFPDSSAFNKLINVDISYNRISYPYEMSLYSSLLQKFDLSNNLIDKLSIYSNSLSQMKLDGNPLTTLSASFAPNLDLNIPTISSLKNLNLGDSSQSQVSLKSFISNSQPNLLNLSVMGNVDTSIIFNNFPNLQSVNLHAPTTNVTVENVSSTNLQFGISQLKFLKIKNCSNITALNIDANNLINDLILEDLASLNSLNCELPEESFTLLNLPKLSTLNLYKNTQTAYFKYDFSSAINPAQLPLLKNLQIEIDPLDANNPNPVQIKNLANLQDFKIYYSRSLGEQNVIIENLESLKSVKILNARKVNGSDSGFLFGNFPNLETADITVQNPVGFNFDKVIFFNLPKLKNLSFYSIINDATTADDQVVNYADFSTCPLLENFNFNVGYWDSTINFINLKNSNSNYNTFTLNSAKVIQFCLDSTEEKSRILTLDYLPGNTINASYNCGVSNNAPYNTVSGTILYDYSGNSCTNNTLTVPFARINFVSPAKTTSTFTGSNGTYNHFLTEINQNIKPTLHLNEDYYNVSSNVSNLIFSTYGNSKSLNYCLSKKANYNDLEISFYPIDVVRPGVDVRYKMIYLNKGTTTLSGEVELSFEGNYMDVLSANPSPNASFSNQLKWNFADLKPFEKRENIVMFKMNKPTDPSNPLHAGDVLHFTGSISSLNTDQTPVDNKFSVINTLVDSFDPNDKVCLEGNSVSVESIGEYVHYKIRFENTGNANATNIILKDLINTNMFDINTLQPISASHNFATRIKNGNEVEFIFENIKLPFNNADNDGYIVFKIKTLESLQLGGTFENNAQIFFDYNLPVTTETAITAIETLSTDDIEINENVKFFPNPVIDKLNIHSYFPIQHLEVFNIIGKLISRLYFTGNKSNEIELDTNLWSKGVYIIKLFTDKGAISKKIIKK